jgi:hypothetical protein
MVMADMAGIVMKLPNREATMSAPHEEVTVYVGASPQQLFAHLDDPTRLGRHMAKPSAMMLGGSMTYEIDERGGREIGSMIRMDGAMLGVRLSVEEVVTERIPPRRKVWETRGPQQMLVIESYRMGFDIKPDGTGAHATIFIDYVPSQKGIARLLGALFGPIYARWCVRRMAQDVQAHFKNASSVQIGMSTK